MVICGTTIYRSSAILACNWTIPAVGEHIVTQQTLPGRSVDIGTDKTPQRGIVITALEVVQPGLTNVVLAATPFLGHFWRDFQPITKSVFLS